MKILKFLGLILFNIVYLYINVHLCLIYYDAIYLENVFKIPQIDDLLLVIYITLGFISLVWITKFLFFPILLTIGSKIKYIKNLVKIIKDNIINKESTLIMAVLFDCAILLFAAICPKFIENTWFDITKAIILFIICGGGILPVYVSMSLWSFLNKYKI